VSVDAEGFAKHRREDAIPLLVDIWAAWCGPCRAMAPMFEQAAAALEPDVRLIKVNADEAPEVASELGVSGIPALLLLRDGQIIARSAGVMSARDIVNWTRSHLGHPAGGA
jgi:thioredoxin 2